MLHPGNPGARNAINHPKSLFQDSAHIHTGEIMYDQCHECRYLGNADFRESSSIALHDGPLSYGEFTMLEITRLVDNIFDWLPGKEREPEPRILNHLKSHYDFLSSRLAKIAVPAADDQRSVSVDETSVGTYYTLCFPPLSVHGAHFKLSYCTVGLVLDLENKIPEKFRSVELFSNRGCLSLAHQRVMKYDESLHYTSLGGSLGVMATHVSSSFQACSESVCGLEKLARSLVRTHKPTQ